MIRIAYIAAAVLAGLVAASSASAAKTFYWSPAQANAAVVAQAKVSACSPAGCPNGLPKSQFAGVAYHVSTAICSGIPGYSKAGRFSRFSCSFSVVNDMTSGALEVRTAGPSTIRWKRV